MRYVVAPEAITGGDGDRFKAACKYGAIDADDKGEEDTQMLAADQIRMAVAQAARAFELFTGHSADVGRLAETFSRLAAHR